MGVLVVAPVLLTWGRQPHLALPPRQVVEAVGLLVALVIVGEFVFGGFFISQIANYPLAYIVFPFVIWAAFRFGQRGAVTATLVGAGLAVWGTAQGVGPFVQETIETSLLLLHGFISTMAITALLLAAALAERNQVKEALQQSQRFIQGIADSSPGVLYLYDLIEQRNIYINRQVPLVLGYSMAEIQEMGANFLPTLMHPDDLARFLEHSRQFETLQEGDILENEYRMKHITGEWRWFYSRDVVFTRTAGGRPKQILGLAQDITEYKQTEEDLKEQRAFLRQVIDINPHLIFAKDRAGRFTLANQAVADVFGTTIEEILGKTDADFNPETAQNEHFRRDDLEVLNTLQEKFIPEESITDAAGQTRWLQTIKRPILDSNGQAHQVLGVATDITAHRQAQEELRRYREYLEELVKERTLELTEAIEQLEREITERRQAEESLRESEDRFHRLSDATFEGVVIHDQGQILDANQSFAQMVGYELAEVQGKNVLGFAAPEYRDLIMQHVQSDYEKPYEAMGLKKDGSTFPAEIWAKIIPYQGRMVRVAAIRDITERKQAEETLLRQNEFLEALHQITLDLLNRREMGDLLQALVDSAATLLDAPYGELMLKEGDELVVRAFTQNQPFLLGDRIARDEALLSWQAHNTGQPAILDNYSAWAGHRAIYNGVHLRAVADFPIMIGQACLGVLALGRDEPDYPFKPEQLQKGVLLSQLAALVLDNANLYDAALREITERKQVEEMLRQQAAELQARNEELDAFAHTVAHDLKVPLGPITGYADILIEDDAIVTANERQKYLQIIARNGRKMNSIIGELLLLASVRKKEVEPTPLDMAGIVAEAQQRLAHLIEEHQAEIILPKVWPVALGYAPWIEEVWANYLSNAIKYGGRPPRLELGATMVGQANSLPDGEPQPPMIRFWVHDNGPGLSLAAQQRLFTPFTQLRQVRTEGQGLGLSIVRRIVEKLGGEVGVESEGMPGRGSIFSFTLPLALSSQISPAAARNRANSA
jgi:PAS domain S-box-containing protein